MTRLPSVSKPKRKLYRMLRLTPSILLLPADEYFVYLLQPKLFGIGYTITKTFGDLEKTSPGPLVAVLSNN